MFIHCTHIFDSAPLTECKKKSFGFFCRSKFRAKAARSSDVQPIPDARAREGIPIQSLPHPETKDRDRACAVPHGKANKNMVSKSQDEVKERKHGDKRTQ